MKKIKHISLLLCCLFGIINFAIGQKQLAPKVDSFKEKIELVQLLTNTQQYSKAIVELKSLENSKSLQESIENVVDYRLMAARIYRLSGEFDEAMREINKIPKLTNHKKLELKVEFTRAALYMENPKYTIPQRVKIVYPIIDNGIKTSKAIESELDLASFYNLKAGMHADECNIDHVNCRENYKIAIDYYKKSMKLFLKNNDTLNFHNCLSGLFVISITERTADLDSLRDLMLEYAEKINYFPNVFASRHRLASYYLLIKKDSINYLKQTILAKNAMIDMVNKNADNAVGQLKLLYEFDSLKSNIDFSNKLVNKQESVIKEKNKSIKLTIIFAITLSILLAIILYFFFRQKSLTNKVNSTNQDLKKSNHNYELLVRESNHRIKNNLQMITSMLELDKENVDEKGLQILTNITSKISTITSLHRILNFKEHNQKVNVKVYFDEIIHYYNDLGQTNIHFQTNIDNISIPSERIIYFGLILNEMISNTLKHRKIDGEVVIEVLNLKNNFEFVYRDNSDFKIFDKGNGVQLIEGLIMRFNGKNYQFNGQIGEYKFYFNE